MKFIFHYRRPFVKQISLSRAVVRGALRCGDHVKTEEGFSELRDYDGLVLFGIGGISKQIWDAYRAAGKKIIFFDKGYTRGGGWYRVAVNNFQPITYMQSKKHPHDRFARLGTEIPHKRPHGSVILFDGASNKFCYWKELGDWLEWGAATVKQIRKFTDYPIVYRPRPSHNGAYQVKGAELSQISLQEDFARARVVVSYGGNIGWDAVTARVPHFAIGDSIARAVSETDWSKLDKPYVPDLDTTLQWCADVAYQQWTHEEIESGECWDYIRSYF